MVSKQPLESRRLERLIEAGRALVSTLDLEPLLEQLLHTARDLTGARYAALGILDGRRESLERFLTVGIDGEARRRIGDLPTGRGVLGELIRDPRPLRVARRHRTSGVVRLPAWPPADAHVSSASRSRFEDEAFGNLYLTEKEGGEEFDQADEDAVVILADWAAVAIENARLYRDADERREELEAAVRRLRAATEIMRALDGETDIDRVLELVVKRARALVEARWTAMLLVEGGELVVHETAGDLDQATEGHARADRGLDLRTGLAVAAARARGGCLQPRDGLSGRAGSARRERAPGPAGLPFPGTRRPDLGRQGRRPRVRGRGRAPARVLCSDGSGPVHTATSVAEDRLRHSIEASEQERRRWARELHDETLQGLGGLQMLLSSAVRQDDERLRAAVAETPSSRSGSRSRTCAR